MKITVLEDQFGLFYSFRFEAAQSQSSPDHGTGTRSEDIMHRNHRFDVFMGKKLEDMSPQLLWEYVYSVHSVLYVVVQVKSLGSRPSCPS